MNYLAHIYLSRQKELITIGNFMADHVKGKSYSKYDPQVQKGILLHRQIDSYTDSHDVVRLSKRRLDDTYGLYRGIIIDIFYDHFLAKNWKNYSRSPLLSYTHEFYSLLHKNWDILPDKIKYLSTYMIRDNWLLSYAEIEGIKKVLEGMNRRTGGKSNMDRAIVDLKDNYEEFESDFTDFFKDLCLFSDDKLNEIEQLYD